MTRGRTPSQEFIDRFGLMVEAEGLPRIAGRLMAFMLLRERPCRAADLASELGVSHGSVSTNTRLLERLGAIERVSVSGDRAVTYRLTPDPYSSLLSGQLDRMRRLHALVAATRQQLPASEAVGRRRLGAMDQFYRLAIRSTEELLRRLSPSAAYDEEQP